MNADRFTEVTSRNDIARDLIAGLAAVRPNLAGVWRYVDRALTDIPALLAELAKVRTELQATRMDRANLLAAIHATLAAQEEGEDDPLGYLRAELDPPGTPATTRRRA
jgi:hypothetical protein